MKPASILIALDGFEVKLIRILCGIAITTLLP